MRRREVGRNSRLRRLRVLVDDAGLGGIALVASVWAHCLPTASGLAQIRPAAVQAPVSSDQSKSQASPHVRLGPHSPSEAEAALQRGTLTVWVPRTFVAGVNPVDYEYHWDILLLAKFKSDFPDFDLRFEVMEREQLERAMHSPPDQHFPDVAFVGNYEEYKPLEDANTVVTMWGWSRFEWHGWWVVFRQAANFAAGEAFLLWLAHPIHYKPSWTASTNSIGPADVAAVQALSREAVRDYVKEDPEALGWTMDPAAARFQAFGKHGPLKLFSDSPVTPFSVDPLFTFGNSRLAFVLLAAAGGGDKTFGMIHSGVILRNTEKGWKILYLLPEDSLPRLEDLLSSFDRLGVEEKAAEAVPEVTVVGPPDHVQLPSLPQPEMEWAKLDAKVATYVFEFQQRLPGRDRWEPSSIILISPASNEPTLRWNWSHASGRWRVWAITKGGVVSISEWREVDLTY